MVKILQGSVVTQTTLGGLTMHPLIASFLQCIFAKNYENWMTVDKVIAKIIWLTFFGPPCSRKVEARQSRQSVKMLTYCRVNNPSTSRSHSFNNRSIWLTTCPRNQSFSFPSRLFKVVMVIGMNYVNFSLLFYDILLLQ